MHHPTPPRKPYAQTIDGVLRNPNFDPVMFRKNINFRGRQGDIVQFTHPKSGTNWVFHITQLILKRGEPVRSAQEYTDNQRFMEGMELDEWRPRLPMRPILTHLPPRKETMSEEAKYIYVARNPWDVCVSFYHMTTNFSTFRFQDGTFDEFFEAFLSEDCGGHGSYFDHVAAGYALRYEPNMFFVTYEELQRNTRGVVLRLAYFLGEEYSRELEDDEVLLGKLLERITPAQMKDIAVLDFSGVSDPEWSRTMQRLEVTFKDGHDGNAKKYGLVREAKVGCWKKHFSAAQLKRMEAKIREVEERSSVMNLWTDIREEAIQLLCES
ncbi:hypothetical protein HPB48_000197 [Haemaphysalis longicornis]|uniref:Sulfotransferase domain-containing protein n=1 Tax=Haemaphysalis longicornis TaxID=44386 RepID=A0A9J6GTP5_HAELO|nr:hypothetical protein HPB48_000197 [Haemaphysalis longicornis]